MLYLTLLLGALLFAGVAMTINEGLWSNTISLLLIMIAGLMALVGGIPLGTWGLAQTGQDVSFTWYYVFASIWVVFYLSLTLMRVVADRVSCTQVRFLPIIDKIAGPLMGAFVAIMFTSFAAFTLWRVPIMAGEWDRAKASETQISAFSYAQTPFYNVAKSFLKSEDIDSPLIPVGK
ncbi:MAG: CvpA family protein [Pirellulales bacterium]|nr:CvpA family protein [Pirellulales bacterium]